LITISQAVGALSLKAMAQRLIRRLGFRTVLLASVFGTAVVAALPGAFRASTPIWAIVVALAVGGFLRSLHFTSANALAYADVPRDQVSQASTFSTVLQQVGMSLGVSFGGLTLHLARGPGPLTPSNFVIPFMLVGAASLLAAPFYWRLRADAGADIGGRASVARAG
jgi:hypothetical protein